MTILQIKTSIYHVLNWPFVQFCKVLPIKRRKIVFSSFNGKGYGENPKYIAEEIIKQKLPYDLVWLVNDKSSPMPKIIKKVPYRSWKARYELSTAKIIINNVKSGLPFLKKRNQYYIQTWHGGFALKYIEGEIKGPRISDYITKSKADSNITDLLLANCSLDYSIMATSFWYSGEILKKGAPRNDIYFKDNADITKIVKSHFHIPSDTKVVLYAPTFRDHSDFSVYDIDLNHLQKCLEQKTKEKWIIIVRLHPNISKMQNLFSYSEHLINGTTWPDPQELVITADLLITDYSSIMYDFMILKKTVFLYVRDYELYKKERGLRPIYQQLPFAFCQTNQELIQAIEKYDKNHYLLELERFFTNHIQSYDDGHASEAVVERIKSVINESFVKQIE